MSCLVSNIDVWMKIRYVGRPWRHVDMDFSFFLIVFIQSLAEYLENLWYSLRYCSMEFCKKCNPLKLRLERDLTKYFHCRSENHLQIWSAQLGFVHFDALRAFSQNTCTSRDVTRKDYRTQLQLIYISTFWVCMLSSSINILNIVYFS